MLVSAIPLMMVHMGDPSGGDDVLADYYVDAVSGNDSNDGSSPAQAFKTITKVNTLTLDPNETVAFKGGQTHRTPFAGLAPGQSGTAGKLITFISYGTGKALISGAADGTAMTWTNPSGNIWKSEAIGHSSDYWRRINQLYTDLSPASGFANNGGISPTGIECGGEWSNGWTQDGGADRWYTSCFNPDDWVWNQLTLDGALQGGPEGSISAVNTAGEWIITNNRLYVGGSSNPGSAYSSVAPARLSQNGDWVYVYDGTDGFIFMYHSAGSPAAQYATLEIPNCKIAVHINNKNYIGLDNIEVRHGAEGIWIDGDNNQLINVNISQTCRNACQFDGDNNTYTGGTIENIGSFWFKRPQDSSRERNGHGVHLSGGTGNIIDGLTIRDINGEDCVQHATSGVGEGNWVKNSTLTEAREDCYDVKDGKANLSGCTLIAKGDGLNRRNGILLHYNCTGLYAEDTTIETVDAGGDGTADCITRQGGMPRPIELKRCTLKGDPLARYLIDAKQGEGDVDTEAVVWLHNSIHVGAMRLVNGKHLSNGDSVHSATGTYNRPFSLWGSSTSVITNMAYHTDVNNDILWEILNGSLNLSSSCLGRGDGSNSWRWLDVRGAQVHQGDLDAGGTPTAGLTVSNIKTEAPGFDDAANDDLTITAGVGAASGNNGSPPATDRSGNTYTGGEIGAYSLSS